MDPELLRRRLGWLFAIILIAFAYQGVLDGPFVYDDKVEVAGNRAIRIFEEWRSVLQYNPARAVPILSYAWDLNRSGLDPRGFHISSMVAHMIATIALVFMSEKVSRLLDKDRPVERGVAVGLLWAVHPMASEAVSYLSGRPEEFAAIFCFLAVAAWAHALQEEAAGRSGWPGRGLGIVATIAGLLSKEVALAVPPTLFLLELYARGRKTKWFDYVPLVALGVAGLGGRLLAGHAMIPVEVARPLDVQLSTSAWVVLRYLGLWVLPIGQTILHDQADLSPFDLRAILGVLGVALLIAALTWAYYRQKSWAWAVAAGLLTLVPSTSVAMLKEHMAEHRAYLLGAFLLLAGVLAWPSWSRRLGLAAMLLGLLLLPVTHRRNQIWADEVKLWQEATEVNPDSAEAWYGLGDGLRFAVRCTEAVPAYKAAIAKDPTYLDGWNNLGICLAQTGDGAAARDAWREALRRRPSYCKAHVNLGSHAYQAQNWEEAMVELRSALAWCPDNAIAHWLMGNIYYGPRKDREKALIHYQELVKVDPRFPHAPTAKERILQLTW